MYVCYLNRFSRKILDRIWNFRSLLFRKKKKKNYTDKHIKSVRADSETHRMEKLKAEQEHKD